MTKSFFGNVFGARASVLDQTLSEKSKPGIGMGSEPLAIIMSVHETSTVPLTVSAVTLFAETIVPLPVINSMLRLLNKPPTPPVRRLTMVSFQAISLLRSNFGVSTVKPMSAAFLVDSMKCPAEIRALDGIQPTLRQVPPMLSCSMQTTFLPRSAKRMAAT